MRNGWKEIGGKIGSGRENGQRYLNERVISLESAYLGPENYKPGTHVDVARREGWVVGGGCWLTRLKQEAAES